MIHSSLKVVILTLTVNDNISVPLLKYDAKQTKFHCGRDYQCDIFSQNIVYFPIPVHKVLTACRQFCVKMAEAAKVAHKLTQTPHQRRH